MTKTFTVAKKALDADMFSLANKTYTGSPVTTNITTGLAGGDYDAVYSNNVNAGTATVTITGKGNYSGTVAKSFEIAAASIEGAAVTVDDQRYTGSALTPAVTVTLEGETLRENTDYTITKWENNTGSSSQVTTATVTITGKGNYTGTATGNFKIASDVHTVTFMSNGSTVGTQSVVDGETANKPEDPTRSGYEFVYWYATSDADYFENAPAVKGDLTLTAKWAPTYTLVLNGNGGTASESAKSAAEDATGVTAADTTITLAGLKSGGTNVESYTFEREGYTFKGFATTNSATEATVTSSYNNASPTAGSTVTLYAVWTELTYGITFDDNAANVELSVPANQSELKYTARTALNKVDSSFKRAGFTFLGWATKDNATVVEFADGANVTGANLGVTSDPKTQSITLYAVWEKNAYDIATQADLDALAGKTSGTYTLVADIAGSTGFTVPAGVTLTIPAKKSITLASGTVAISGTLEHAGTLTLGNSKMNIALGGTLNVTAGEISSSLANGIDVSTGDYDASAAKGATLTMSGGKITNSAGCAIRNFRNGETTLSGDAVVEATKETGNTSTIKNWGTLSVQGNAKVTNAADEGGPLNMISNSAKLGQTNGAPVLNMTGGTLEGSTGIWVYNAKGGEACDINISGGTVTGKNDVAIYMAHEGTLDITGGTISGTSGVQILNGTVNITGGTISATGNTAFPAKEAAQTDGSNEDGAAVSVVSRDGGFTRAPISLTISKDVTLSAASTNGQKVLVYGQGKDEAGSWKVTGTLKSDVTIKLAESLTGETYVAPAVGESDTLQQIDDYINAEDGNALRLARDDETETGYVIYTGPDEASD